MKKLAVNIDLTQYERLQNNPLFFLKFYKHVESDYNSDNNESIWHSTHLGVNITIQDMQDVYQKAGYALCIADSAETIKTADKQVIPNCVNMTFHTVRHNSVYDWQYIINCFIIRSQNKEDKYAFAELLWSLDRLPWDTQVLTDAMSKYPQSSTFFLISNLQKIGRCLSYQKQKMLQTVCSEYHRHYNIYLPDIFKQAYACLINETEDFASLNLFDISDAIFYRKIRVEKNNPIFHNNPLLRLRNWIETTDAIDQYDLLVNIIPLISENLQLTFLKRYFHDIRSGNTNFNIRILEQIRESKFDYFIRYRFCIKSPSEEIRLTIPLLCDSLITLYHSKGTTFQTFRGILDYTLTKCDVVHPAIDFQLKSFLPVCNHGAIYNKDKFKGFIDFSLICKLDENLMSKEHLHLAMMYLLSKFSHRTYNVCKYGDGSEIPPEVFSHCNNYEKKIQKNKGENTYKLECYLQKVSTDQWIVPNNKLPYINKFLNNKISVQPDCNNSYTITWDMISLSLLKEYIKSLPAKYQLLESEEFAVPSFSKKSLREDDDLYLILNFSQKLRMRIFPKKKVLIGSKFDIFGYWSEIRKGLSKDVLELPECEIYKKKETQYIDKEMREVNKRVIDSLKKELHTEPDNEGCFELPFNQDVISKVLKRFYFSYSSPLDNDHSKYKFLKERHFNGSFQPFCAPTLAEKPNPALNLQYFWCMGKECFHNSLGNQSLQEENDWRNYNLFHMAEIIGYPQLRKTEIGYESNETIRQFIAIISKVAQMLKKIKCKSCGHLLFTYKSSEFNRYNYYACTNPSCPDFAKPIYINFCFHCKKGLIDSRESKQCPNGWYICPTCLSCCDDAQYERLAQRYVLSHKPVPMRIESMRGHGHNDKQLYFCPKCGNQLERINESKGQPSYACKHCQTNYSERHTEFD